VQTATFTPIVNNTVNLADTSASAFTATLPAAPNTLDSVLVLDYAGTFDSFPLTIDPNGGKINGDVGSLVVQGRRQTVELSFLNSTQGWYFPLRAPIVYTVLTGENDIVQGSSAAYTVMDLGALQGSDGIYDAVNFTWQIPVSGTWLFSGVCKYLITTPANFVHIEIVMQESEDAVVWTDLRVLFLMTRISPGIILDAITASWSIDFSPIPTWYYRLTHRKQKTAANAITFRVFTSLSGPH
jgi:hypothetical protein